MKSRIFFYLALGLLVVVCGFVVYRLIVPSKPILEHLTRSSHRPSEAISRKGGGEMKLSRSTESQSSVWSGLGKPSENNKMSEADLKKQAEVQNNLGVLLTLYEEGNDEALLKKVDELIAQNPQVPEYIAMKGDYYYNNGQWAQAEAAVKRLLEVTPDNVYARSTLGELQAIQERYGESLETYDQILHKDPGNISALYGRLSVYDMKGESRSGQEDVLRLWAEHPGNGNLAAVAADIYVARGDLDKSTEAIMKGLKADGTNARLLHVAGLDADRRSHPKEAFEYFRRGYDLSNDPQQKMELLSAAQKTAERSGDTSMSDWVINEVQRQTEQAAREFQEAYGHQSPEVENLTEEMPQ